MNISVDNGDVNGDHCYMNSSTLSKSKNQDSINYTNKRDVNSTNMKLLENNGLPNVVGIGDILPESTLKPYVDTEYNNEHNNLQSNGDITTSKK